jgi:hypothetical protein
MIRDCLGILTDLGSELQQQRRGRRVLLQALRREHVYRNVSVAMHSDTVPEHACDGELFPLVEAPTYLHLVRCSSCGTEFAFEPDSIG